MADSGDSKIPAPINIYTAMMILSFVAISIGCLILAIELWSRGLPLDPKLAIRTEPPAAAVPEPAETSAESEASADAEAETSAVDGASETE